MTTPWYLDSRMLAAGNARGLAGGDPFAAPAATAPKPDAAARRRRADELGLSADELADLVAAGRARLAHPNRTFSPRRSRRAA
jgi:hypothetical protein